MYPLINIMIFILTYQACDYFIIVGYDFPLHGCRKPNCYECNGKRIIYCIELLKTFLKSFIAFFFTSSFKCNWTTNQSVCCNVITGNMKCFINLSTFLSFAKLDLCNNHLLKC